MKVKKILALCLATSLILTGCDSSSAADIEKMAQQIEEMSTSINEIVNNINSLSTQFASVDIDTEGMSESIANMEETVNEFNEWSAGTEDMTESIDEIVEGLETINASDVTADEIVAVVADQAAENIKDMIWEKIQKYIDRGNKAIADATKKANEGQEMVLDGVNGLQSVIAKSKSTTDVVDKTYDNLENMIDGTNVAAEGAELLLRETVGIALDVIADAKELGIENDDLDALEEALENTDIKIYFIGPDVVEEVKASRAEAKKAVKDAENMQLDPAMVEASVNNIFDKIVVVNNSARAAEKQIADIYAQLSDVTKVVVKELEKQGIKNDKLDDILASLEEFEEVNIDLFPVYLEGEKVDPVAVIEDARDLTLGEVSKLDSDDVDEINRSFNYIVNLINGMLSGK